MEDRLAEIIKRAEQLAYGRVNDAVKLILLDSDFGGAADIDALDLSLLSEVKRGAKGVIEVKLIDRLEALELLSRLTGAGNAEHEQAASFYGALEASAAGGFAHSDSRENGGKPDGTYNAAEICGDGTAQSGGT